MWLALPAVLFVVAMSYVFQTMPRESDSGMSIGASHHLAGRSGFLLPVVRPGKPLVLGRLAWHEILCTNIDQSRLNGRLLTIDAVADAGGGSGGLRSSMPRPEVPEGAAGEVARVLAAATHYEVLEVPHDAGAILHESRVKSHYIHQCMSCVSWPPCSTRCWRCSKVQVEV